MSNKKPIGGGMRFNTGKLSMSMIPLDARVELARVYTIGGIKYERDNWLKGMPWLDMIDSAERHFALWQMGLTRDPDTGCHHLAQAAWNILGLLVYELRGLGTDDRTKLPIDENFNWVGGPAAGLNLGLSKEELEALRVKYEKMRAEHKAKLAAVATEIKAVKEAVALKPSKRGDLEVVIVGRLTRVGGQDTEGRLYNVFEETGAGETHSIQKGDTLTVRDNSGKIIFQERLEADVRAGAGWPNKNLSPDWFDLGYKAQLNRPCRLFDPWHIGRTIPGLYRMSKEKRAAALQDYTSRALAFAAENGCTVDMIEAAKVLESFQEKGVA